MSYWNAWSILFLDKYLRHVSAFLDICVGRPGDLTKVIFTKNVSNKGFKSSFIFIFNSPNNCERAERLEQDLKHWNNTSLKNIIPNKDINMKNILRLVNWFKSFARILECGLISPYAINKRQTYLLFHCKINVFFARYS